MQFETERVIIRKPEMSDADDIFRNYTQDPDVTRYLTWKPHRTIQEARDCIQHRMNCWEEQRSLPFIIQHKESAQAIGMIDFFKIDGWKIEFGYVLAKDFWGQGIMTEAGAPILKTLITREGIYRIEATHDLENPASGRVMEKWGMRYEGILRRCSLHPNISPTPRDCKLYSMVK